MSYYRCRKHYFQPVKAEDEYGAVRDICIECDCELGAADCSGPVPMVDEDRGLWRCPHCEADIKDHVLEIFNAGVLAGMKAEAVWHEGGKEGDSE